MAVVTVAFSDLDTWLSNQPANTIDTPYELNITGLTVNDIGYSTSSGTIGYILNQNNTKFVDLSETILPDGVTTLYNCFNDCSSLTQAPIIPNTVTNLNSCFVRCTSLTSAPAIPTSVTSMQATFSGCTSLEDAPFIPNTVTNMLSCFYECTSLEDAPLIPDSVTSMGGCFNECTSLTHKSILPSSITSECYDNVTTLNWKGTESQVNDFKSTLNQQSGTFEVQVYDSDRVTYIDTFYGVEITSLSTWLSNQTRNTTATPYEVMITCLTTSNCSSIAPALVANPSKFVDLSFTDIPSGASCDNLFEDCRSLTKTAVLPSPTSLVATYKGCINLQEIPTIPNTVTDLESTFEECFFTTSPIIPSGVTSMKNTFNTSKLTSAPTLPSGLLNMEGTFEYCFDLVTPPTIPSSVTNMKRTFNGCSSLTTAPTLPSGVTDLTSTFESTLLTTSPTIPGGVTSMDSTFKNCSRLVTVTNVPSTVTRGKYAFLNCSLLKKISEFLVSTTTLDSTVFRDMFKGCTALEEIGHKVEAATDLHLVYLYFDSNSHVQGKIYSRDKTSVTIAQTTVTKTTLSLPILTDELLFDSTLGTTDIENIIEGTSEQAGMLDTHYSWFGKIVIPPTGDYFVLYAKNKDKFRTNLDLGGGGTDVEVVSTSKAFTLLKDKRIIVDTSSVTVTLNYGAISGVVAEVFAMESCTLTYYTAQSTTDSLSMSACSKAVFIYYSGGWHLNSSYGTTNSVTADNMQSVSSDAVYSAINGLIKIKDIQINFSSLEWTHYSQGGFYGKIALSNYLTKYTTILCLTTRYWTGVDCRGFYPCFDSQMTYITVLSETNRSSYGGYIDLRIVYI